MEPIKLTERMLNNGWRSHTNGMLTREPKHEKELFLSIENEQHGHNSCVLVVQEPEGCFIRKVFKSVSEALELFALDRNILIYCTTLASCGRLGQVDYVINRRGGIKAVS